MRQTDKLFPLRIIRLVVYSGKRCSKPFVNGKYEPIPAGMKVEYSGVEDISAGKFGKLTYINNKAEVGEFDIKLPVAVEYAWGTVEFDIVCHVAKTVK